MARKTSRTLTDGETRLMNVLWRRGPSTVGEIAAALARRKAAAYNTVQTMMRILEEKGYVEHEQVGRAFVYRAVVDQPTARRQALGHLMKSLFDNSPRLLLDVLKDEPLDPVEAERLRRMIERHDERVP
jgi:BlaI family transcriptional regulator, penicillinase repressor